MENISVAWLMAMAMSAAGHAATLFVVPSRTATTPTANRLAMFKALKDSSR